MKYYALRYRRSNGKIVIFAWNSTHMRDRCYYGGRLYGVLGELGVDQDAFFEADKLSSLLWERSPSDTEINRETFLKLVKLSKLRLLH